MRLLLVEDDPALAEGIAEFLRGQGDEVEVEGDGMRADRLLQNNGYDFVLLDVGLPGSAATSWCVASASAASACR